MPYTTVIVFAAFDALPAADLNSNFSNLDYLNNKINSQFIIPASAIYPSSTAGAAAGTLETATNRNNYNFIDFADTGGNLFAECVFPMPADYNGGTVTVRVIWTANSTSTNQTHFGIQAVARGDDDALDVAFGTQVNIYDPNKSTAYDVNISDLSTALTIAGTPAAGELVNWRIFRSSGDANDTLAATVRLIALIINYTRS